MSTPSGSATTGGATVRSSPAGFRLSVAVPVFNEAEVVGELIERVGRVLDGIAGGPHELLFVDDGSSDATVEILEAVAARDARVVVVALSRNFGHQAALAAALDHVHGDAVVLMDGDLQDPPEAIPRLLEEFGRGHDVVYARRVRRKESWWLRACYYLFYRLIGVMSEIELPLDSGDFAILSRRVVDEIRRAPEHNRYLRGLRSWVGFRQKGIDVERSSRAAGQPKYGLLRLLRLAFDGIFSFSIVPIRISALAGSIAVSVSLLYALVAVYTKVVLDRSPQGFTAIIMVVVFLAGVQLLSLGVIGEYVGRVYEEVKRRPLYVVRKVTRGPLDGS